jgi:hypothetical protein
MSSSLLDEDRCCPVALRKKSFGERFGVGVLGEGIWVGEKARYGGMENRA